MSIPMLTSAGLIDLENPDLGAFAIEHIALPLSRIVRFAGNTTLPYTVAQHCLHVSTLVPGIHALDALLHDCEEAFVSDIPSAVKDLIGRDILRRKLRPLRAALAAHFGLSHPEPTVVRYYDRVALATEIRDLCPAHKPAGQLPPPDPRPIIALPPEEACARFLARYRELGPARPRRTRACA